MRYRRTAQVHCASYTRSLSAITQGITGLKTQFSSSNITTASTTAQQKITNHLKLVRAEAENVASGIPSRWIRDALSPMVNEALEINADKLRKELHLQPAGGPNGEAAAAIIPDSNAPAIHTSNGLPITSAQA